MGVALPVGHYAAAQVDWPAVGSLALNLAVVGLVSATEVLVALWLFRPKRSIVRKESTDA